MARRTSTVMTFDELVGALFVATPATGADLLQSGE
jgi:hypothetical protein